MPIEIREVKSRRDLKTFIYLPEKIHAGHKNWVHPLFTDDWKYFDSKKNKAFGYCDTVLLLAWKDGRPVGRVMGIINHRYNEHRNERTARFGYPRDPRGPGGLPGRPDLHRGLGPGQGHDQDRRAVRLLRPGPRGLPHRGLRSPGHDRHLLQFRVDAPVARGGGLRQGQRLVRLQARRAQGAARDSTRRSTSGR